PSRVIPRSPLASCVLAGDAEHTLAELPEGSVDLVFTSPPYFNARPHAGDFLDYGAYLDKMQRVLRQCRRVLADGRFLVLNTAPVLLRRASRSQSSRRPAGAGDPPPRPRREGVHFLPDRAWGEHA